MVHNDAVAATCTTDGSVEYWHCTKCNKNYADQFIVGSLFHNFSILDKQDLVYILNRGQPVCNHDNCFAPHQFLESLLQLVFIFRICSCRSLIHNDDIRILSARSILKFADS